MLSEQTKLEAQIGFTLGILIGATAGGLSLLLFTTWEWYLKLFSLIGTIGIIGSLVFALLEQLRARRNYLEILKEMEKERVVGNGLVPFAKGTYGGKLA